MALEPAEPRRISGSVLSCCSSYLPLPEAPAAKGYAETSAKSASPESERAYKDQSQRPRAEDRLQAGTLNGRPPFVSKKPFYFLMHLW